MHLLGVHVFIKLNSNFMGIVSIITKKRLHMEALFGYNITFVSFSVHRLMQLCPIGFLLRFLRSSSGSLQNLG